MIKHRRTALLVLLLILSPLASVPVAAAATTPADTGGVSAPDNTGTTPPSSDPGTSAPITLNPEQIQAMQDAADGQSNDRSVFQKVADFVTDNAPFFIIGIVVIAAIAAGILILRGRSRAPATATATGGSAAERRRRKRAETQRAREEERIRRQARRRAGGGQAGAAPGVAPAYDPDRAAIEAEKLGADQDRAAGAVARARGPVSAPYSPSQTAPTPGVVTEPPMADPQMGTAAGGPSATAPAPEPSLQPPVTNIDLPAASPDYEPSLQSPGPDATVGRNAAAFAAATGAGAVAGRHLSRDPAGEAVAEPYEEPGGAPPAADEFPARPGPVYDERLRSTLDDLRSARLTPDQARPALDGPGLADGEGPAEPSGEAVESDLSLGLAAVERRLSAEREQRDRVLRDAEDRLRRIEQRAEDAERRAAFAERLAHLKVEESEREERLRNVMSGIERAERRAGEAEERARAAELSAAAALEESPAEPGTAKRRDAGSPGGSAPSGLSPRESSPEREESAASADEAEAEVPRESPSSPAPKGETGDDRINLNDATFEQLRGLGLSVTQATRILAYRERFGGYSSLEDLDKVPGFTPEKIDSMRARFTV